MLRNYQLSIINYQLIPTVIAILKKKSLKKTFVTDHWKLVIPRLNGAGFTLIEILVALAILAVIGTIAIPNFRQFNSDQEQSNTTSNLIRLLQQTQSSSQSQIACVNSQPLASNNPAIFWDLQINDPSSYQFQAECIKGDTGAVLVPTVYETVSLKNVTLGVTSSPGGTCPFPAVIRFLTTSASLIGTSPPPLNGQVVQLTCGGTNIPGLTQVILNINQTGFIPQTVTIESNGVVHQ